MVARPGQTGKTSNELVCRLLFVFIGLVIFRLGSFVPVPGINTDVLEKMFSEQSGNVLGMFNMFSGGALSRASILALGIMPYISSAIIIQLMAVINPTLAELKKEGESGRRTLTKYTRWGTLFLGLLFQYDLVLLFRLKLLCHSPFAVRGHCLRSAEHDSGAR